MWEVRSSQANEWPLMSTPLNKSNSEKTAENESEIVGK